MDFSDDEPIGILDSHFVDPPSSEDKKFFFPTLSAKVIGFLQRMTNKPCFCRVICLPGNNNGFSIGNGIFLVVRLVCTPAHDDIMTPDLVHKKLTICGHIPCKGVILSDGSVVGNGCD